MKHPQQIVPVEAKTTFADVWQWGQELEHLHARIARRFARPEPRRRALAYLKGRTRWTCTCGHNGCAHRLAANTYVFEQTMNKEYPIERESPACH